MARYRADLIETAWEVEDDYGTAPSTVTQGFGLLTGGITLPDPRYEWEPFYGIGVDDRNLLTYVQGRQVFEGSFPSIYLCHDNSRLLLGEALGLIFNNTAAAAAGAATPTTTTITKTGIGASPYVVTAGQAPKYIVVISQASNAVPNSFNDTWAYIGATVSTNVATIHHTRNTTAGEDIGWQGKLPPAGAVQGTVYNIERSQIASSLNPVGLKAPANITHSSTIGIRETLKQNSFTLAAKINADNGKSLTTNFMGCKMGGLTLTMEEGRPVTVSMDFTAQDMNHNMPGGAVDDTLKYLAAPKAPVMTAVTEQPYFFSRANVKLGGTTFAKCRRLTISIANALDPRYYVTQSANADNRQVLSEILEGRRTVTVSGSIDMDDTATGATAGAQSGPDIKMLQYLFNQGFNTGDPRDALAILGLSLEVELKRNSDNANTKFDKMTFSLPGDVTTTPTIVKPGLVFNSARFAIPGPNQVHQNIEFDAVARSMRVSVEDTVS